MPYQSTKRFGHEVGLSCAFRQWRAQSHCRYLHGYALAIKLTFEADQLDERNWVVDFGSMKSLKGWLEDTFDHKLLVAEDDPQRELLERLGTDVRSTGSPRVPKFPAVADVIVVPRCGCEGFAELIFQCADIWLKDNGYAPRCRLVEVEVAEHGANSAIYTTNGSLLVQSVKVGDSPINVF